MVQCRLWSSRGPSRERVSTLGGWRPSSVALSILEDRGGGSNEELPQVLSSPAAGIRRPIPSKCRSLRTLIDILVKIDMLSAKGGLLHRRNRAAYHG